MKNKHSDAQMPPLLPQRDTAFHGDDPQEMPMNGDQLLAPHSTMNRPQMV